MKIIIDLFKILNVYSEYHEPRGRYYPYDERIRLSSIEFSGKTLIVALILFALGWLFSNFNQKHNEGKGSCLGGLLILAGIIFAIPSLLWIQAIGASIYIVCIIVIIIVIIISSLWKKINNR